MQIGLILMVVGMVTVFIALIIIIELSKLLIVLVNKIAPEEEQKRKATPAPAAAIPQDVMAVIQQTVAQVTGGKGTVAKVEKL